jgi:peptidoglycan/xylan/chitin deacetylase (PgdA/CDA1 family)
MAENYFLYYEELDWAARRGDLPFRLCSEAMVHHHGGTTIGTGSVTRLPSGFANYFNYRNRMRFMWRFHPTRLPLAYGYSMAVIATLCARGAWDSAVGAFCGLHRLSPPAAVRARLSPEAAARAFGQAGRHHVVNFHGIGPPHEGVAEGELPYWLPVDQFSAIIDRVVAKRGAGHDIRITFDDGNLSDLEIAAPILQARGLQATFFVLTGRLNQTGYLTPDNVRALRDMGHEIGLHGHAHLDWRRLDAVDLRSEIGHARALLEAVVGQTVRNVGIPFGAYDRRVISHLRAEGFDAVHTSDGGPAHDESWLRPRTSLRQDMDDRTVEAILMGHAAPAAQLRRRISTLLRRHVL